MCLHFPTFFLRDPKFLPEMIKSLKNDARTNLENPDAMWKFMSEHPETTNFLVRLFSNEGTPANYRSIDGFAIHTFIMTNE